MEILEFGNKNNKKIIFIHGFQSVWQRWERYIEYYKNDYHIIVPIVPGHNQNKKEKFISFEETAKELEDYIISRYGNNIYAIYGVSMGGVLAATLWQNKKLKIEKLIFDGSPLCSFGTLMKNYLSNFYLKVTHKSQARDEKTIENAQKILIPKGKESEFLKMMDNLSDESIVNFISEMGKFKLARDMDVTNTQIYYYHGTKLDEMLSKKTAKYIKKWYPKAVVVCLKGTAHCEGFSGKFERCVEILDEILKK